MAIDFPNSPTLNQVYTVGTKSWKYDGSKWILNYDQYNVDNFDYIGFNLLAAHVVDVGEVAWNATDNTLDVGLPNGVTLQLGQEMYAPKVLNNSGVLIPDGSFVMATGAQGDQITVAKAVTNGTIDPMYMLGIATEAITIGMDTGRVTTNGIVHDVNTSAWAVGTILYPDPAVAGGLTGTKPDAPNIRTPIAIVLRQHATTGRIYVRMTNGSTLGGTDSNVAFSTLSNNDVVIYDSVAGVWKNRSAAIKVSDTPPSSPFQGQMWFSSTNGKTYIYYDSSWVEVGGSSGTALISTDVALSNSLWLGV